MSTQPDAELQQAYEDALNRLPSRAPIFLPTERVPLEDAIKGVKRVDHIYKNTLDSVYRPKLKALRKKHKGSKRCFIIGNGPSLNETDLELLKDEVTFAVNGFFLKSKDLSWTPTYYVVEDHLVAEDRLKWINEFKGPTKLFPVYLGYCFEESDDTIFYNHRPRVSYPDGFDFSKDAAKITYTGCTVTFSCMQLAHYMGFEEIYLIGVDASYEIPKDVDDSDDYNVGVLDMKSDDPNHFHPDYFGKGFRWHDPQVHKMVEAYAEARRVTDKTKSRIYNATVGGKLEVFDRVPYNSLFSETELSQSQTPQKPDFKAGEYPKVLIYDITLAGNGTATGEIKSNLFKHWPKDRLAQFYSTGSEKFGWHTDGLKGAYEFSPQQAVDMAKAFDPDVILFRPVLDNIALHKAAMNAINWLEVPFVSWYMDDWPARFRIENPKRFSLVEDDFKYLIEHSSQTLVIGDMMAKAYQARHGREFIPLANGVQESDWPQPKIEAIEGRPFKVRYAGSLAENMTMNSLLRVAEAVELLSKKYDVVFEIKTLQLWYDKVKSKFKKYKATSFFVENLSNEDYRKWIRGADTLVIAYNFDARSKIYTKYSVANKMPECLASGAPVLAYGPSDVATIDLLQKYDCASVLSDPDKSKLVEALEALVTSVSLRQRISEKGRAAAFKHHNLVDLSAQLKGVLSDACLPSVPEALEKNQECAIIIGNGPSLKGFDFSRFDEFTTFGMNAAYRFWDEVEWYPDYYSCLDLTVGLSHKAEIKRLIENAHLSGIRQFLLRGNLVSQLSGCINADRIVNFDSIRTQFEELNSSPITTGSHSAAWASTLGYKKLFLMGVDCNYIEIVDGAVKKNGDELVIKEEKENPNYFFDGYQKKGDVYNKPNPERDVHIRSWREIKHALDFCGTTILNANFSSKVDAFDFCRFEDIGGDGVVTVIDKDEVLGKSKKSVPSAGKAASSSKLLSDIVYPRSAQAGFDETFLIFKMYEGQAPGVMIDVGAHYGGSARPFAKEEWTIFCQEPDPSNRAHLTKSLGKNPFVKIDPRAVGEAPETGRVFYSSDESTGISGMLAFRDTHKQSATVDVTTVKDIIADNDIQHVDFLKIDVEGYDFGVLKGVPWDTMRPDVIECEFEDAKTKHLGHNWRDICEYLAARGYTVYVSEWHPIVRYGISHDWRALKKYPCELDDIDAWGNLLAFKTDPGEGVLCEVLERVMKIRNKDYKHVAPPASAPGARPANDTQDHDIKRPAHTAAATAAKPARVRAPSAPRLASGPAPSSGPLPSTSPQLSAAGQPERFADKLRRKSPVLFRIAQIGKLGAGFIRRHMLLAVAGFVLLCGLVLAPIFVGALKPFALYFWIAAAGMMLAAGAFIGLSFANLMAHRIANRELAARQTLKHEILRTLEHQQKQRSSEIEGRMIAIEDGAYERMTALEYGMNASLETRLAAEAGERRALSSKIAAAAASSEAAMGRIDQASQDNLERHKRSYAQSEARRLAQDKAHESLSSKVAAAASLSERAMARIDQEMQDSLARYMVAQETIEAAARKYNDAVASLASDAVASGQADRARIEAQVEESRGLYEAAEQALEARFVAHLEATEGQLAKAQAALEGEAQARSVLSRQVSAAERLSETALERIENETRRNSTSFMLAQEQLEARLADRLKATETQLEAARTALETEGEARRVLTAKMAENTRLSETASARVEAVAQRTRQESREAQEQVEARLAVRLKAAETQLEAARTALETEGEARRVLTTQVAESTRLSETASAQVEAVAQRSHQESQAAQAQLEARLTERLKAAETQLEEAREQLANEAEARTALMAEIAASSTLSKAEIARFTEEAKKNSAAYVQGQDAFEARITARLKDAQAQLLKTEQDIAQGAVETAARLEQTSRDETGKLEAEIAAAKDQIATLEASIAQAHAAMKDLDAGKPAVHQHFNRALSKEHIKAIKADWLKPLNLSETDRSLAYMSDRISNIERTLKGRLATSIENAILRTLVAKSVNGKDLKVLEIGVLFGIGLAMVYDRTVDIFENVHVTALDPFEGYYGDNALDILTQERITRNVFIQNMEAARVPSENYTLIEGYSADDDVITAAAKQVYDVLIIDGDHSYAGVKSDFVNYAPMVKRGGYILIDDDMAPEWPEITKYVDDELVPRSDITLVGRSFRTAVFKVIKKVTS